MGRSNTGVLDIALIPTTLTLTVIQVTDLGFSRAWIEGRLTRDDNNTGIEGVTLTIYILKPDGTTDTRTAITWSAATGNPGYYGIFYPGGNNAITPGHWEFQAEFIGNATFEGC